MKFRCEYRSKSIIEITMASVLLATYGQGRYRISKRVRDGIARHIGVWEQGLGAIIVVFSIPVLERKGVLAIDFWSLL